MALIRWEPVRELNTIQTEMNRLFNSFFDSPAAAGGVAQRRWIPAMDLVEHEDEFVLRADLPGVSEEDVHVGVEDNVLTISGERKAEHEERKEGYYRVERASGNFSRSLTLPEGVNAEAVTAHYSNGVLEVRVPKPEARKPHRVSISVGGAPKAIDSAETATEQEPAGNAGDPVGTTA